jgi:hypothetical protein
MILPTASLYSVIFSHYIALGQGDASSLLRDGQSGRRCLIEVDQYQPLRKYPHTEQRLHRQIHGDYRLAIIPQNSQVPGPAIPDTCLLVTVFVNVLVPVRFPVQTLLFIQLHLFHTFLAGAESITRSILILS